MGILRKCAASVFAAAICAGLCAVPALASEIPDYSGTGEIRVTVTAYGSDEPVSGGTLEAYKAADAVQLKDGSWAYSYTDAFAGCDASLLSGENIGKAQTASQLAEHADNADYAAEIDAEGCAVFTDVPCGAYLITQGEGAEGYSAVSPFLVTVPCLEDSSWTYSVDASPKTAPVSAVAEDATKDSGDGAGSITDVPDDGGNEGQGILDRVKTGEAAGTLGVAAIGLSAVTAMALIGTRREKHGQGGRKL